MRKFYVYVCTNKPEIGLVSELPKKSLIWHLEICHTENYHRREEPALNKEKWQCLIVKGAWHDPEESKNGDEQSHGPWKVKRQEKHELWGELNPIRVYTDKTLKSVFCVFSVMFFTQIYIRNICEILQHQTWIAIRWSWKTLINRRKRKKQLASRKGEYHP